MTISVSTGLSSSRYGPALRELFSLVVLEGETHALQVLHTLQDNAAATGSLRLIIRKLYLLVGSEGDRMPAPAPTPAEQQAAAAAEAANTALENALAQWVNAVNGGAQPPPAGLAAYQAMLQRRRDRQTVAEEPTTMVDHNLPAPLSWITAQMILQRSPFLHALTVKLPRMQTLDESAMTTLTQLKQLRKLDIGGQITFKQLKSILTSNPHLRELEVIFMKPEPPPAPAPAPTEEGAIVAVPIPIPAEVPAPLGTMHLTSITLAHCQLKNAELREMLRASQGTLRNLSLSNIKGITRFGFKAALTAVGKNLRVLALHKLTFTGVATQDALPIHANLLDDLPTICPRLEELTVASPKICSEQHFLTAVVPGLFLTQLELDYPAPSVDQATIMGMIMQLPAGRMETLCFGEKMAHFNIPEIQRACQEIGIVLLSSETACD